MSTISSFTLASTGAGFNTSSGVYTIDKSIKAYNDLPKTTDGFYYTTNGAFQHLFVDVQGSMTVSPANIHLGQSATSYSTNADNTTLVNGSHPLHQLVQIAVRDANHTVYLPFTQVKNIMLSNTGNDPNFDGQSVAAVNNLSCSTFMANVLPAFDGGFCTDPDAITTSTVNSTATTTAPPPTTTMPPAGKDKMSLDSILLIILGVFIGLCFLVFGYLKWRRNRINSSASSLGNSLNRIIPNTLRT